MRQPILHNGEAYNSPVERVFSSRTKEPSITYDEARTHLKQSISAVKQTIESVSPEKKLPHEYVLCYRMETGFEAKSYRPDQVINAFGITSIGSRIWRDPETDAQRERKLFFARVDDAALARLEKKLDERESRLTGAFKLAVRRIERADFLNPAEQIAGFDKDWKEGQVELVLHPFGLDEDSLHAHFLKFIKKSEFIDHRSLRTKKYKPGMTFASVECSREALDFLAGYNPLRSAHPMPDLMIPDLRSSQKANTMPQPPHFEKRPAVTVGVFDGGIVGAHPYLTGYSENHDVVKLAADPAGLAHGTAVTGAILYGALNDYKSTDTLPTPNLYVKHFRVLPRSNPGNTNLYEVIDAIEETVANNKDIDVYSLSLGPRQVILDDSVTRFTTALDILQAERGVVFSVAVGNDGDIDGGYGRIQPPSDSVNAISVGSHTRIAGSVNEVDYSCYGPGREGGKHKPDVSAFGGCERNPIHLLDIDSGNRLMSAGTSFATPQVAAKVAQLIGYSGGTIDHLTAKALMVHKSQPFEESTTHRIHHQRLGYGTVPNTQEEILDCEDGSYTLIYRGTIPEKKYVQLRIPWLSNMASRGFARFHWTLGISSPIDMLAPDDYTATSVETFFYPNVYKYRFTNPVTKQVEICDVQDEKVKIEGLLNDGWVKSDFPVTDSGAVPFSEEYMLRSSELKWDTIDCRMKNKRVVSVKEPMFHLHALTRGVGAINKKVQYSLILTVKLTQPEIDVYSQILQKFKALAPVTVSNEINVKVATTA